MITIISKHIVSTKNAIFLCPAYLEPIRPGFLITNAPWEIDMKHFDLFFQNNDPLNVLLIVSVIFKYLKNYDTISIAALNRQKCITITMKIKDKNIKPKPNRQLFKEFAHN